MCTMGKLLPLSPHFIHGTIIRTGIQFVLYFHVFNTTVFALFKFKTFNLNSKFLFQRDHNGNKAMLMLFLFHPSHKKIFVTNICIYIQRMLYLCIYMYIYIYMCMYVIICLFLYLSMYICIYVYIYGYMYVCIYHKTVSFTNKVLSVMYNRAI